MPAFTRTDDEHRKRDCLSVTSYIRPSGAYFARFRLRGKSEAHPLWALSDVSFQVSQGQTFALTGGSGAGKPTLLTIPSGITQPPNGTVKVYGRLASLLGAGTGFHPEFSGCDNIFEFSGADEFIHIPAKSSSSGMCVRPAFSVAAHMSEASFCSPTKPASRRRSRYRGILNLPATRSVRI